MLKEKINLLNGLVGKKEIDNEKREKILIIFLLGVFLLLIATPVSKYSDSSSTKKKQAKPSDSDEIIMSEPDIKNTSNDAYISYLENKLEQTIGGMDGAGRVSVMITLNDGGEKILDKNRPYESTTNTETVLIKQDGNTAPIVIKEQYPDVCGVVVLCEGGDDRTLSLKIKEVCGALFSLESHKIVVGKLSFND